MAFVCGIHTSQFYGTVEYVLKQRHFTDGKGKAVRQWWIYYFDKKSDGFVPLCGTDIQNPEQAEKLLLKEFDK